MKNCSDRVGIPRKTFKIPKFRADVKEMSDLKPGMTLEGTVTNVTNFGAFVDIGVRQDGLVHLSQMSNRFIRDPREAVKVGDVVQVKVISIEPETKRIGLSMKALLPPVQRRRKKQQRRPQKPAAPARKMEVVPGGIRSRCGSGSSVDTCGKSTVFTGSSKTNPAARWSASAQKERRHGGRKERRNRRSKRRLHPKCLSPRSRKRSRFFSPKFRGIN